MTEYPDWEQIEIDSMADADRAREMRQLRADVERLKANQPDGGTPNNAAEVEQLRDALAKVRDERDYAYLLLDRVREHGRDLLVPWLVRRINAVLDANPVSE